MDSRISGSLGYFRLGRYLMNSIFLSASVPEVGRGDFYLTAKPFLIQLAVRELVIAIIRDFRLVWGGHPSITPMVWTICEDINLDYSKSVVLYQSKFFRDRYPEENERFQNAIYTEAVQGDRDESLKKMREEMIRRPEIKAAVFIGGMEGIEMEYAVFRHYHPEAPAIAVGSPGGASLALAERLKNPEGAATTMNFAALFAEHLDPRRIDK